MARAGRIIRRVFAYGLIGLIVNVLVAWGFAAWGTTTRHILTSALETDINLSPYAPRFESRLDRSMTWSVTHDELIETPNTRVVSTGYGVKSLREVGPNRGWPTQWSDPSRTPRMITIEYTCNSFGWPATAMQWHEILLETPKPRFIARGLWVELPGRGPTAAGVPTPRRLPLEPAWPGIALNSILFGAITAAAHAGWLGASRSLRRHRGLCPACAYDLRGDHAGGCPECGWQRAARTEAPT